MRQQGCKQAEYNYSGELLLSAELIRMLVEHHDVHLLRVLATVEYYKEKVRALSDD
jgi:hypothetical protein